MITKSDTRRSTVWISIAILFGACASTPSGGAPSDVRPFEEQTGSLISQVEFELQLADIVLLNPFLDTASPKVDEFEEVFRELTVAADGLVDYSVGVSELARAARGEEAVEELIPLLRSLGEAMQALPDVVTHFADVDIEGTLQAAAEKPNLTKALRAAAPLTNGVARALRDTVIDANDRFDLAFLETQDKIFSENAQFIAYVDALVVRRNQVFSQYLLFEQARQGDSQAWRSLLESDEELQDLAAGVDVPTAAALERAEQVLLLRLARVTEIWGHLQPSYDEYQAVLTELYAVDNDMRRVLKVAKFIVEDWDRAQRQMAKGRPNAFVSVASGLVQLAYRQAMRKGLSSKD